MKTMKRTKSATKGLMLVGAALALGARPTAAVTAGERPTAAFRTEHAEVKEHLAHLHQMAGKMAAGDADAQKRTAAFVAKFLNEHLLTHAKWEEEKLYPAVDRRTHEGTYPFTGTMRYEHRIIGRSVGELTALASGASLDATEFARRTDGLLGLVAAHFEEEEEVLLPILDKGTTREALEKELGIGEPKAAH